ncbi:MAG: hypothetical protein R3264_17725, partial [Anaerolineae bacterium]|nr:hypothetical protein [Anaerolineae bacterium]
DTTAGSWELYFDGSDVGLSSSGEDIDGLAIDAAGDLYLSTVGTVAVSGLAAEDEDVGVCSPSALGTTTICPFDPALFIDGSTLGLETNDIDAFSLN